MPSSDLEHVMTVKWWFPIPVPTQLPTHTTQRGAPIPTQDFCKHYVQRLPIALTDKILDGHILVDINKTYRPHRFGALDTGGVRHIYRINYEVLSDMNPQAPIQARIGVRLGLESFGFPEKRTDLVICNVSHLVRGSIHTFVWNADFDAPQRNKLTRFFFPQLQHVTQEYHTWEQHHTDTTTTDCLIHVNASFGGNPFKVSNPSSSIPKPVLGA